MPLGMMATTRPPTTALHDAAAPAEEACSTDHGGRDGQEHGVVTTGLRADRLQL